MQPLRGRASDRRRDPARRQERVCGAQRLEAKIEAIAASPGSRDGTSGIERAEIPANCGFFVRDWEPPVRIGRAGRTRTCNHIIMERQAAGAVRCCGSKAISVRRSLTSANRLLPRPTATRTVVRRTAAWQHENLSMPRTDGAKRFVSRVACEHDRRMGAEQLDLFTSGPIAEAILCVLAHLVIIAGVLR